MALNERAGRLVLLALRSLKDLDSPPDAVYWNYVGWRAMQLDLPCVSQGGWCEGASGAET